jgi:hypothetical protein
MTSSLSSFVAVLIVSVGASLAGATVLTQIDGHIHSVTIDAPEEWCDANDGSLYQMKDMWTSSLWCQLPNGTSVYLRPPDTITESHPG